jgi:hypothetical protein
VLPLGSIIWIEGFGERMVLDIGGKVKGFHVDIFMSSCAEARRFGRRHRRVRVLHRPRARVPPPPSVDARGFRDRLLAPRPSLPGDQACST